MSPARYSPLYHWLAETLRRQIEEGTYKPGDALPTEHELMRRYALSCTTVRRAVHDLVRDGLIYRQAGKGTFVRRAKLEENLLRLTSFAEEMQIRHITPQFRLIRAEMIEPSNEVMRTLNLPAGARVFHLERIQIADREPIAVARGYWIAEIGEQLAAQDLNRVALYEIVENEFQVPLVEAEESIASQIANADTARKLKIAPRAPLLVRRRVTYSTNMRPIEFTTSLYRADRYEYKVRLARHGG
ncbi:MAG: GntR family transcriptional regulator [Chloroflexi bacterium]|nr:GntR family transcriptional regulator [Chloroflexota bacterium]